ncbi:hypothetical protein T484DRAFT_1765555 [Baffinella frigidus]|nr:hypothetical protein T484DRAFT_1765555 [Cryptophyta sp. CCMP2293]
MLEVLTSLKDTEGGLLKGIVNLYDGLLPNLLKEGPSASLYLGIYELELLPNLVKEGPSAWLYLGIYELTS